MENIDIRLRCLELAIELSKAHGRIIVEYEVIKAAKHFEDFILQSKNED